MSTEPNNETNEETPLSDLMIKAAEAVGSVFLKIYFIGAGILFVPMCSDSDKQMKEKRDLEAELLNCRKSMLSPLNKCQEDTNHAYFEKELIKTQPLTQKKELLNIKNNINCK